MEIEITRMDEIAKMSEETAKARRGRAASAEWSQNQILRMGDEKTMELIDLYEKEECLWNTHLEDYKNREKRAKAAEKIAKRLGIPKFEARHVIIKFKNLRNSYCQELKKISNSLNAGNGPDTCYRPKVFWFAKMHSFLRPHLQQQTSTGGSSFSINKNYTKSKDSQLDDRVVGIKREPCGDKKEEDWSAGDEDFAKEEECWVNPLDVLITESKTESYQSISEDDTDAIDMTKQFHGTKRKRCDSDEVARCLQEILSEIKMLNRESDYYDNFGRYIASLLRSLPQDRAFHLQPKIISLITSEALPHFHGRVSQSDE